MSSEIICVLLSAEANEEFTLLGEKLIDFCTFRVEEPSTPGTQAFLIYDDNTEVSNCENFEQFKQALTEINEARLNVNQGKHCVLLSGENQDMTDYINVSGKYSVCLDFSVKSFNMFYLVAFKYNVTENSYLIFDDGVLKSQKTLVDDLIAEINLLFAAEQEDRLIGGTMGVTCVLMFNVGGNQVFDNIKLKLGGYATFLQKEKVNFPCICDKYNIDDDSECVLTFNSGFIKKDYIADSYYTCLSLVIGHIEKPIISNFQSNKLLTILVYTDSINPLWAKIKSTWSGISNFLEMKSSDCQLLIENYGLSGNPSFLFYKHGQQVYYGDISYINCYYIIPSIS